MDIGSGCEQRLQACDEIAVMQALASRVTGQLGLLAPHATPLQLTGAFYSTRVCPNYLVHTSEVQAYLAPCVSLARFEGMPTVTKVMHLDYASIMQPGQKSHLMELAWPAAGLLQPSMGMVQARGLSLRYLPDLSKVPGCTASGPGVEAIVVMNPAGQSLASMVDPIHAAGDRLVNLRHITSTFKQVVQTMVNSFPKGFTHGDIKPANICIDYETSTPVATLIDLGCSFMEGQDQGPVGSRLMTPAFSSPHRLTTGLVSQADDLFAVASSLVYCLLGNHHHHRRLADIGAAVAHWQEADDWHSRMADELEEDDSSAGVRILLAPSAHHRMLLSDHRLERLRSQAAGPVVMGLLDLCASLMMPHKDEAYRVPLTQVLEALCQADDAAALLELQGQQGHMLCLSLDSWPTTGDDTYLIQHLLNLKSHSRRCPASGEDDGGIRTWPVPEEHRLHHLKELHVAAQARAHRSKPACNADETAHQETDGGAVTHGTIDWVPRFVGTPEGHVTVDWCKDAPQPTSTAGAASSTSPGLKFGPSLLEALMSPRLFGSHPLSDLRRNSSSLQDLSSAHSSDCEDDGSSMSVSTCCSSAASVVCRSSSSSSCGGSSMRSSSGGTCSGSCSTQSSRRSRGRKGKKGRGRKGGKHSRKSCSGRRH